MKTDTIQPTNAEKSAQLNTKAQQALLAGIAKDWKDAEDAAKRIASRTIFAVNKLRACGEKLKQLCGHEQISLDFYMRVQANLPKSMRYTSAKCAVHVSNRLAQDVTTVQEAMAVQRDLFAAMNEYKEPKRLADQHPHERNPWSDFIAGTASLTRLFDDLDTEPMERWDKPKLQKFVETTKPIVDKYQQAAVLLEEAR